MTKSRALWGVSLGLAVAGCAVGPDYHRPEAAAPERFARDEAALSTPHAPAADEAFWESFGDPLLNDLIERGLAANRDLVAAIARYDSANALLREARFDQIPSVVARAEAGRVQVSQDQSYGFPRNFDSYSVGAIASWELDLFGSTSLTSLIALGVDWSFLDVGRVRARLAASQADAAGSLAQYQQAVLRALEDVENALVNDARTREEHARLEQAAEESIEASRIAHARYQSGAIDYYELLDSERVKLAAQDAAAESLARSFASTVALYEALAGGWPQRINRTPIALSGSSSEPGDLTQSSHL